MKVVQVSTTVLATASLVLAMAPAGAYGLGGPAETDGVQQKATHASQPLQRSSSASVLQATGSITAAQETGSSTAAASVYDISKASVSGVKASYTYTGSAIKPKPVLKIAGKKVPKSAYKVKYVYNKKVGVAAAVVVKAVAPHKGSITCGFTIVPKATSIKTARAQGAGIVVTWKKRTTQTSGYELCYSTSKSMSSATKKKIAGAKKNKLAIRGLKTGKTYYVKVRTYKGKLYSAWSRAKKVKLVKPGRKDLTKLLDKAASKNKGTKSLKMYNSTYQVTKTKAGKKLLKYIKKLRKNYRINIAMIDVKSGEVLTYSPMRSMYSASCLKGPYVASLNKWKPSSRSGHKSTMRNTIVWSDNDTYASLRNEFGSETMRKMHVYSGVDTDLYYFKYHWLPTRDLAKLWVGTYWYFYESTNANSKWTRSLYTHGYESFIYRGLKGTWKVHAKPGWYPGEGKDVQNDAGVVMAKVDGKSRPYVVAYMTSLCGEHTKLRKLVRLVDDVHTDMFKSK